MLTIHAGERQPGGAVRWRVHALTGDPVYARHVAARLLRRGLAYRIEAQRTARPVPTSADEAAWHVRRTR
jgi:hypothetical protein